ncbi:TspO/MBR family protein [Meinhardsimonia xiamenensis]|nr:TspO/MBR family protein [Meinhardsimonia xiamenensis]
MPFLLLLAPFLLAVIAAAASGVIFPAAGPWYQSLNAPSFQPPNWLFGPVWTVLYLMIAVCGARLAVQAGQGAGLAGFALGLWALQITLNALWTPTFFGAHALGAALVIIGALWLSIAALMATALQIDRLAGWLLAPYLGWVSFAAVLNWAFWRLN